MNDHDASPRGEGGARAAEPPPPREASDSPMFLGIDIGSSTTKGCLVSASGELVGSITISTFARHSDAIATLMKRLEQELGVTRERLRGVGGTGYGRNNIPFADCRMTELSCHAKGARYLHPTARTVIDIGGQDSKVIHLGPSGEMLEFAMNEKCAAGTGKFLEAMARTLNADLADFAALARESRKPLAISTICTVFAESEVISHIAKGAAVEDVVKAVHNSVAEKVGGMARRASVEPDVVMTGGVARNSGVVEALERVVGMPIAVSSNPQIAGALGAALFAAEQHNRRAAAAAR
ncbi:MAG: 2-hydroxyglutaryl-CoA dehydratase [Polyangiaceae bacterium]|nr:2-hydroxyglutaryl-CoA dehydratase [Polyangiaceae bacterium]